jgi:N-acetylneuraminic acid mutarotase
MPVFTRLLVIILSLLIMKSNAQEINGKNFFNWKQAKQIPDEDGFAGSYAGVTNAALLVAGGSNFPGNKRPWTGGTKTWYDKIFILEKG